MDVATEESGEISEAAREQIEHLNQQIFHDRNVLEHNSDFDNNHIIEIYEARLLGEEDPYDVNEILKKRKEVREEIVELEEELEEYIAAIEEGGTISPAN